MRPDELIGLLRPRGFGSESSVLQHDLVLELVFWAIVGALTVGLLVFRPAVATRVEAAWKGISRRQGLAIAVTILAALIMRAALLPVLPIPEPVVHDEYSYLLQAQTFAAGRMTNPTPPLWVHFETFHVNMQPTYQSMYPPAQGLLLAFPMLLHVHPWWAVWLSVGLMCGAVCWMLQAWVPPHWALLGGMFCVVRFAAFSYWINSYWGGALAAIGGALVLGALPRIKHRPGPRYPLLFALGLALLANTRPYEGFVFSIPALLSLLLWAGRNKAVAISALAPAAALLALVVAGMGYYNWRGTGKPTLMPYQVNQEQYHITKPFIWQKRNPIPQYRHPVMRSRYVRHELPDYLNRQYREGLVNILKIKALGFYNFFLWPLLALLVFSFGTMLRSSRMRLMSWTFLLMLAAVGIEQWSLNPHYAAPVLCAVVAMMLNGLRLLRTWTVHGLPLGRMLARSVVICFATWVALPVVALASDPYVLGLFEPMPAALDRARLIAQLQRLPGQHLVIVHNHRSAIGMYDWVYNDPDPDQAKIIWARDMGKQANAELVRYYSERRIWFVDQDDGIRQLRPYPGDALPLDPTRTLNVASSQALATGR